VWSLDLGLMAGVGGTSHASSQKVLVGRVGDGTLGDASEDLLLEGRDLGMPDVEHERDARLGAIVEDLVLEAVVEHEALAVLVVEVAVGDAQLHAAAADESQMAR